MKPAARYGNTRKLFKGIIEDTKNYSDPNISDSNECAVIAGRGILAACKTYIDTIILCRGACEQR